MSRKKGRMTRDGQRAGAGGGGRRSRGTVSRAARGQRSPSDLHRALLFGAEGEVLASLGEEQFERLRQVLYASWPLADSSQKALIESLAAAIWRLERADPAPEGPAISSVRALPADRPEPPRADDPGALRRRLSVEACAVREVLQICHQLLKTQAADREAALTGQTA